MSEDEDLVLLPGVKFNEQELEKADNKDQIQVQQKNVSDETTLRKIALDQRNELLIHLRKVKQSAEEVHGIFERVHNKVKEDTSLSCDGFDLLQVRNYCLCSYLESLAGYGVMRCSGSEQKEVDESITGLSNNRCVVEKIKPLEKQMQYKMQKLDGILKGEDSVSFRANPDAMLGKVKADEEETGENGEKMVSAQYQAPKVSSTLYPKAESDAKKEAKYARSIRARTKADALMDEVAADMTEDPLEAGRKAQANREVREFMKRQKEIENFEEEHFVRIQRSKKDKAMMKKLEQMQGSLDSILDYGHIQSDQQRERRKQEMKKEKRNRH